MNHARLIFEDAPAFIPVPREMQHRKVEITFLPLDDDLSPSPSIKEANNLLLSDDFLASLEK